MAPPTGPRAPPTGPRGGGRGAVNARSSRISTGTSRGTTGGGITKRSRPARTDRDGDLDLMSAPSSARPAAGSKSANTPSSRRGDARSTGPRASSRLQRNIDRHLGGDTSQIPRGPSGPRPTVNNTTLSVAGLKASKAATNPDGGLKGLVEFLEKKATHLKNKEARTNGTRGSVRPVYIKKSHNGGDLVYIMTNSQDAEHIVKINGFSFAGSILTITRNEDGWPATDGGEANELSGEAESLRQRLQSVLASRYSVESSLLTLSALGSDPVLVELGLLSDSAGGAAKTFKVLMKLCDDQFKTPQEKRDAVSSVTLSDNALESLDAVFDLARTFPQLKHLDLSRNRFSSLKQLQKWRGHFKSLETLLLNDNPIIQTEPNYGVDIMKWFPKLQNLSGAQVRTPEEILLAAQKRLAKPIPQRGNDFRDINGLAQDFVLKFFPMYDSDRTLLLQTYYDERSIFTLSVANEVPKQKDTVVPPWSAYIGRSRNFMKITNWGTRWDRQLVGIRIQKAWTELPATQHPSFETGKYVLDCHPLKALDDPVNDKREGEPGMTITVHGEFSELEADGTTGMRSFTRTFILGPSISGRAPIRVVNDMLVLHAYNPITTGTDPAPEATAVVPDVPVVPVAPTLSPEEQQQLMITELTKRTKMTPVYSKLCLQTANWDFDQALAIFEEKKSTLPADAFDQL